MSDQQIGNLGIATGSVVSENVVRGILVPTFSNDKERNVIDHTGGETSLTKLELKAHLTDPDISKRWQLLPAFNDADLPIADSVKDTAPDGIEFNVRKGSRSFTAMMKNQDSVLLKGLTTADCRGVADWSMFLIEGGTCASILTEEVDFNIGRPYGISKGTFEAIYHYANNTTKNDITILFTLDKFFRDENIRLVEVDKDADILRATGVVPVEITDISSITATGMTATMKFNTGFLGARKVFTGAVDTDFELNAGAVTITTVTENPTLSGIYDFVFPSTPATVITVTSSAAGVVEKFEVIAKDFLTP